MILLPCPVRPDLDCIAGAFAYAEFLGKTQSRTAKPWLYGTPDGEAQFYLDLFNQEIDLANENDVSNASAYILVDFSTVDFFPEPIDKNKVVEVIDHRFFTKPEQDFPNARVQLEKVGAAATQIAEYFILANIAPSYAAGCMLYGAIFSHTQCRHGPLFTERDGAALHWLKQVQPDADKFVPAQFAARQKEIIEAFPQILTTEMKTEQAGFGPYSVSQLEMTDGTAFWQENRDEIARYFQQCQEPVFLNIIDVSTNESILYFSQTRFCSLLDNHAEILARDDHAVRFRPALMRKQLIPLINNMS